MTTFRAVRRALPISRGMCLSVVGLFVTLILLPKLAPIWITQILAGVSSLLSFVSGHLLYGGAMREWFAGAAFVGGYIRDAIEEVQDEREFTEAERDAFRMFATEVQSLSVQSSGIQTGGTNSVLLTTGGPGVDTLETVRNRYRDTVMDVPGHEEMYDDTLAEHIHAEFGEDLAAVVLDGGPLTQPAQALLAGQAAEAAAQRDQHLEIIDAEYDSLLDATTELRKTEPVFEEVNPSRVYQYSFEELTDHDENLRGADETCQQLLDTRQAEIHNSTQRSFSRSTRVTVQEYLYQSLEMTYPVIATTLERIRELNNRRRIVIRSIAQRY